MQLEKPPCRLRLPGWVQVMLGGRHSKGLGCSGAGREGPSPLDGQKKELQKKPRGAQELCETQDPGVTHTGHARGTIVLCLHLQDGHSRFQHHRLVPTATLHLAKNKNKKSRERFLPAKASRAGATLRAVPRPVHPHPSSLYLRLPSNPAFSRQPAAFGGLKRCVPPRGSAPLPPRPSLPGMDLETRGSPDLISKTNRP